MKKKRKPFSVGSMDELQKALFIQSSITRAAENEVLALAMMNKEPEKYIHAANLLLEKYAQYPTLSEFAANPKLTNVYKWGATFGVAALVGGLILEQAKNMQPKFAPAFLRMLLLLLRELDQPEHEDFTLFLCYELGMISEVMPWATMLMDLSNAVESLIAVSSAFGLMARKGAKVILTPVGKRVLMHLADAAKFIDEMNKAHAEFQSIKQNPATL